MTGLAIDVHDLRKSFGSRQVIDGLTLQVPEGEICGFLGGNGSGKTTTIRMLCGLLRPDGGGGTCLGMDLLRDAPRIRLQVGYMTQRFSFYGDLTVAENLEFVARLYQIRDRRRVIAAVLERIGLADRADQLAQELSGGWKQRMALAACVLHRPRLLLLDEPTAGVDAKARREFWDMIHEMAADGMTVLVSTHYMDEAERCQRVVYLSGGRLVVQGTADDVVRAAHLVTFEATGDGIEQAVRTVASPSRRGDRGGVRPRAAHRRHGSRRAARRDRGSRRKHAALGRGRAAARRRVHPYAAGHRGMRGFSFARLFAMLIKELLQMRRDRATVGLTVMLPMVQLFLFGYAINANPRHLPTGLLAAEHSTYERTLAAALQNTGYFDIRPMTSEDEAEQALARGDVMFVLNIPPDFSRRVDRGEAPQVLMDADATDPTAIANATAAVVALNATVLNRDLPADMRVQPQQPPFQIVLHGRYNPEQITALNIVPGLIGLILTVSTLVMTTLAITRERESGTMENLLATPVRPVEVMLGKIIPYVGLAYVQIALILLVSVTVFAVPVRGSVPLLLLALGVFIACNLAMGFAFSTMATTQMQAQQLSQFGLLPSIMLSGFMFPFMGMPAWARFIGEAVPLTHALRICRGMLLKGNGLAQIWPDLWPMMVFAVVVGAIAVSMYRETLD